MKKKIYSVLGLIFLVNTFFFGAVDAAYLPEYDKYIIIETNGQRPEYFPLDETTAKLMFNQQEAFIQKLEEQTGLKLDHSYIWVVVDGETILAIDPPVWMP